MVFKGNWKDIIIITLGMFLVQIICAILVFNLFSMDYLIKWRVPLGFFSMFIGGIIYTFRYNRISYYDILFILILSSMNRIPEVIRTGIFGIITFLIGIGIDLLVFRLGIFTGHLINRNNQQEIKNNKM